MMQHLKARRTTVDNLGTRDHLQPITMWKLTVWAYRRQMVQYETDRFYEQRPIGALAKELGFRSGGGDVRGCINGAGTTAHADAHVLHRYVRMLAPAEYAAIINAGRVGLPPVWSPMVPELRVVPVRKAGGGDLRMVYGRSHRPIACLIEYVGVSDDEAERMRVRAREVYARWWRALRRLRVAMLHETGFSLWKIAGIGAVSEPWNGEA